MGQPDRRCCLRDTVLLSGWLSADLLLALPVIFLSANTLGVKPRAILTPPQITPTAAPPPLSRLGLNKQWVKVTIDTAWLLAGSPSAMNELKRKTRAQAFLQKRTVGLVIAYNGAPDPSQIDNALEVSKKVMAMLASLDRKGFAFTCTSYYDPLYILYRDVSVATIDISLFTEYLPVCPISTAP